MDGVSVYLSKATSSCHPPAHPLRLLEDALPASVHFSPRNPTLPISAQTCHLPNGNRSPWLLTPSPAVTRFLCSPLAARPGGYVPSGSPPLPPRALDPASVNCWPLWFHRNSSDRQWRPRCRVQWVSLRIFLVVSAPLTHVLIPSSRHRHPFARGSLLTGSPASSRAARSHSWRVFSPPQWGVPEFGR